MPINNSSFNLQVLMEVFRKRGERVNYFIGMKCTCQTLQTGSPYADLNQSDPNCVACHGIGLVWISSGQIVGLVDDIQQHKELLDIGIAQPGDMVFSPQIGTNLAEFDMIQFTWPDGITVEPELITRGSAQTDNAFYGILSVPASGCITVNSTTGVITQYYQTTDFTFSGNIITWLVGHGPATGAIYSFKYNALVDWIVFTLPQPRRERGTSLGQKVILRKRFTAFNSQAN